jgi:Uma2 family endonuclease
MSLPTPHRFSVDDFHLLVEEVLPPDSRVELLDGEVIDMAPIGYRHGYCVALLTRLFIERLNRRALVWAQSGLPLNLFTELQPDVALLRPRDTSYGVAAPGPEDVLLVVEVADSSGRFDRTSKVPMYLKAGIPEVWVVDLNGGVIDVFIGEQPTRMLRAGDTLSPHAFPDVAIEVGELLV